MPIYEFKCNDCGHRFEKLCSTGEGGEKFSCPKCGVKNPQRVFSAFSSPGNNSGKSSCGSCSSSNCSSCH